MATGKNKKNLIPLGKKTVAVYASPKISDALKLLTEDLTLYEGVRFAQLMAIYDQGKKDGARAAFDAVHLQFKEAEKAIPHRNPGKPKKKT